MELKTKAADETVVPCCPPLLDGVLGEADADTLAGAFKALANPARLRLVSMIAGSPEGRCACDLVAPLGRSQPTVSHHLRVLREAGLVESERRGPWIWYRVVPERLEALRVALA
ncbi:MAG: metalloregulator ArsR/SmtB family transcription factor [Actinomycetota bacterium]|nr:metalloregulator ArsR/SmtB family transcription factor [Actinomycetota bacterium]